MKTRILLLLIAFIGISLGVEAQNETINGTLTVKSNSDAIATFQTLDDRWLYTQWKNSSGVRKAYMGFDPSLTNFILGLENGANKFTLGNGSMHINSGNLNVNSGTLNVRSNSDAIATFQTLDDSWLYTQWKNSSGVRKAYIGFNPNLTQFRFSLENGANSFSFNGGNVGIGTYNPGSWKLAVNGKIRAKEVKVETGWADFVFYDDYELPTLEDVEIHIEEKGHLKDIPSEKEVEENGILLGEMNAKLLQKIEELTLYTIQQQKEIEAMNVKLNELSK